MTSFLKSGLAALALTIVATSLSHGQPPVPEIDPSLGAGGLTLLAGTMMVIRGLRKR